MRVMEFKIGNSQIIFNDASLEFRTEEERNGVFQRFSNIAYGELLRQQAAKEKKEKAADAK
ncbi:MAG: hypothetical protein HFI15_12475 [Lachnospiraceae bacterium]|nr:hypothetical protein [Lachnospiraceae bacterium]